jgi:predicted DNA-binding protein (MmcQ/YjbR family)
MDAERMRAMLLALPHVTETMQWGANLVFWTCDKTIGGKMFALVDLDGKGGPVISYAAGPERFAELVEREGIIPAPYLARAHWVAIERWDVFRPTEWANETTAARNLVFAKLSKRLQSTLESPFMVQRAAQTRKVGKKAAKPASRNTQS